MTVMNKLMKNNEDCIICVRILGFLTTPLLLMMTFAAISTI